MSLRVLAKLLNDKPRSSCLPILLKRCAMCQGPFEGCVVAVRLAANAGRFGDLTRINTKRRHRHVYIYIYIGTTERNQFSTAAVVQSTLSNALHKTTVDSLQRTWESQRVRRSSLDACIRKLLVLER